VGNSLREWYGTCCCFVY